MMNPSLFDFQHILKTQRRKKSDANFIFDMMLEEVEQKIKDHDRRFEKIAVIGDGQFDFDFERVIFANELNFASQDYDLIIHLGALNIADDVIGQMVQSRLRLNPDGVFISAFLGGESLNELRQSMLAADISLYDGAMAHIAPMIDLRDAGGLLQRAGFALPVADNWVSRATYDDGFALMYDLRHMGMSNPLYARPKHFMRKDYFVHMCDIYAQKFACEGDRIYATYELIFLTGYAPSSDQPKPLRPGSVKVSLDSAIEKAKEH